MAFGLAAKLPIRMGNSPTKPLRPGSAAEANEAQYQKDGEQRQPIPDAADFGHVAGLVPVRDDSNASEERSGRDAVIEHVDRGAIERRWRSRQKFRARCMCPCG